MKLKALINRIKFSCLAHHSSDLCGPRCLESFKTHLSFDLVSKVKDFKKEVVVKKLGGIDSCKSLSLGQVCDNMFE